MSASELNADTLKSAFDTFNESSSLLEASYRELQDKVSLLAAQLQESRSARHRELLEKERLSMRLSHIIEAVPGAIVVLDGDGIIRDCNSVAIEMLNSPLSGRAWSEVARREFRSKATTGGELRLADGRLLSLARRPLAAEPGEILLLADITESRQTAELVQRQQRLSAIGEMTARLAHQIRTPLASAMLYASQLDGASQKNGRNPAGKISERLNDLARMVNDMLRFAGGARDAGELVLARDLLTSVVDNIGPQAGNNCEINIELDDDDLSVSCNRDALKAAILNLVSNAVQACGADGRIEIAAMKASKQICFTVTDNGHGVPAGVQESIFEPFFTTRPQGTGLGLAVVRSIAEAHGGEVLVHSDSSGTTFCICLPLTEAASEESTGHIVPLPIAAVAEYAHG